MSTEVPVWNEQEQKAIIHLCILAALADGSNAELEREEFKRILGNLSGGAFDLNYAFERALKGQLTLTEAARNLSSNSGKALAYEMAVCTCLVDHEITPPEQQFLSELRQVLKLEPAVTSTFANTAQTLTTNTLEDPVVETSSPEGLEATLDQRILASSILAGALELLPQTLATLAIVPVQIRMVYQIGSAYGYKLDRGHIREFLGTLGVGLTSQILEKYVTRFVEKSSSRFTRRIISSVLSQASGSAVAFVTTYAIGHAAKAYYSNGRKMTPVQLRSLFGSVLGQGRTLQTQYASSISQRSAELRTADLLTFVKSI
jgi:uncharacterized protein (DUF697 family)